MTFDAGFLLLWFWVALGVRAFDRTFGIPLPGWMRGAGIILMALRAKLKGLTVARVLEVRLGTIALSPAAAFVLQAGQSLENPVT